MDFDRGLQGVPLIGDNFSDVLAAQAVGARPILVGDAPRNDSLGAEQGTFETYADLAAAANVLIAELGRGS